MLAPDVLKVLRCIACCANQITPSLNRGLDGKQHGNSVLQTQTKYGRSSCDAIQLKRELEQGRAWVSERALWSLAMAAGRSAACTISFAMRES